MSNIVFSCVLCRTNSTSFCVLYSTNSTDFLFSNLSLVCRLGLVVVDGVGISIRKVNNVNLSWTSNWRLPISIPMFLLHQMPIFWLYIKEEPNGVPHCSKIYGYLKGNFKCTCTTKSSVFDIQIAGCMNRIV